MLGDKVSAKEAEELGMIYKVFSVEEYFSEAEKTAQTLSQMPTKALGMTKRLLNQSMTNTLTEQLELEGKLQIEAAQSEDYAGRRWNETKNPGAIEAGEESTSGRQRCR